LFAEHRAHRTDVAGGSIRASNVALHVLIGIGFSLPAGG
jgi:hypothetical protein